MESVQICVSRFVQPGRRAAAARLGDHVTASETALGAKLNHSRGQNLPEWQVYSGDGAAGGGVADSQRGLFPGRGATRKWPSLPRPRRLARARVTLARGEK